MEQRKKALEQARQVIYASNVAIWIDIYDYLWVMLCFFYPNSSNNMSDCHVYIPCLHIAGPGSVSQWSPEVGPDRSQSCFRGGCNRWWLQLATWIHGGTWWDVANLVVQIFKRFWWRFWMLLPSSDFRFRSNGQLTSVHHWRLGLSGVDRQRNLVWSF